MNSGDPITSQSNDEKQATKMECPDYSIVIPAYNEAEELPSTLEAIRAAMREQSHVGEIVVVDNNSSDRTSDVAKANGADQVVFEAVNQISRARNAGGRAAQGAHLIFIDADTRIEPELLKNALQLLNQGHAGGGAAVQFEGKVSLVGRFGVGLWGFVSRTANLAAGSFIFCQRDGFQAINGFSEELYAGEEIRFSRELKKWGKAEGKPFSIITSHPVRTSARKLQWYSGAEVFGWMFFMMIFPIAIRWRKLCGFWYRRPEKVDSLKNR